MSNKYLKYFLLMAVVGVWATIVYRIIHGLSDPVVPAAGRKTTVREFESPKEDSFRLYADYPDPFLPDSSEADPKDSLDRKNSAATAVPLSSSPSADYLPIEKIVVYNGIISNPKKGRRVAIVTVRGKEFMVREQETVEEIRVLKITGSKLLVSYKGDVFSIEKQRGSGL